MRKSSLASAKISALGTILCGILSVSCFLVFFNYAFRRSDVHNVSDLSAFTKRELPGFIHQGKVSKRLLEFRQIITPHVNAQMTALQTIIALRRWVRDQQSDSPDAWKAPYLDDSEDPKKLIEEQRNGSRSACRRLSYILLGSLLSFGMDARIVHVAEDFNPAGLNHTLVEVWVDDLHKWVLVDPTFDTLLFIDGTPASAIDVYLATANPAQHRIAFHRDGSQHAPLPDWETYARVFKHLYVAQTNAVFDGYSITLLGSKRISFLHLVNVQHEFYPERKKRIAYVLCICFTCASVGFMSRLLLHKNWLVMLGRAEKTSEKCQPEERKPSLG